LILENAAPDIGPRAVHDVRGGLERFGQYRISAVPVLRRDVRVRDGQELRTAVLCGQSWWDGEED